MGDPIIGSLVTPYRVMGDPITFCVYWTLYIDEAGRGRRTMLMMWYCSNHFKDRLTVSLDVRDLTAISEIEASTSLVLRLIMPTKVTRI